VSQSAGTGQPLRIGAVSYLNSKPLTLPLPRVFPEARIVEDLPSRLADLLAAGALDVALVPSIEHLRQRGSAIVSDACVSCEGPVRSVKLFGRVPVERIRTLALDEGSRTSAVLAQILLRERFGLTPALCRLPIGAAAEDACTDAIMLIGDRGMFSCDGPYAFVWDLGQEWTSWTGLPFVFSMWVARPGADLPRLGLRLAAARDQGVAGLDQIARQESAARGLAEEECLAYLRDHLRFHLGERQRQGLELFFALARRHGLVAG